MSAYGTSGSQVVPVYSERFMSDEAFVAAEAGTPVDPGAMRKPSASAPLDTGGAGGNNNNMEARIARIESDMEHVKTDVADIKNDVRRLQDKIDSNFKFILVAFGSQFVILVGIMAKGFGWY